MSSRRPYSISGRARLPRRSARQCAMTRRISDYKSRHYGSVKGEELARSREDIWVYPGPSVTKRIEMAVEIALHCGSTKDVVKELAERIGSGPAISETVPAALGILIANQGDTMESIYDAVNIGDETSAIACIVGAIAGACNGADSIPEGYLGLSRKKTIWILRLRQKGLRLYGRLSRGVRASYAWLRSITEDELIRMWPQDSTSIAWMEDGGLRVGGIEDFCRFRKKAQDFDRVNYQNYEYYASNGKSGALTASGTMKACEGLGIRWPSLRHGRPYGGAEARGMP